MYTREKEIAKILLKAKAVVLSPKKPFTYASGIKSPIYCDNRLLISSPTERSTVLDAFLTQIKVQKLSFDVIAGTSTAGIPWAAWLADRMDKPMVYVRGGAKDHGKKNLIEGKILPGQSFLLIEDLVSTGQSSVAAVHALKEAGVMVVACLAIFTYEMAKAKEMFANVDVPLYTLTNFSTLIDTALESKQITADEKKMAEDWNYDPEGWGKKFS
jgi:orotate phosphoribosyltransferase